MTKITARSVLVNGDQGLLVEPTANAISTLSSLSCQATAVGGSREFLTNLGFTSSKSGGDKVALYAGVIGNSGTSDIWAINTEIQLSANSGTGYNAQGYELDLNNENAPRGTADGNAGMAAPVAVGLSFSGSGDNSSTAAISITGLKAATWNRGIVFPNPGNGGAIAQASFQDNGNATISLDIRNTNTGSYSIDTSKAKGVPLRIPNNSAIVGLDAAGTADISIAAVDTANDIQIGSSSSSFIVSNAHFIPALDNHYDLGFPSNRWVEVFAVNGTIQTADPSLKTDINPLPSVESLVKGINPITFRWKQDRSKFADVVEDQVVHATERQEIEEDIVVIRDGKAVRMRQTHAVEMPLYDELPVEDEGGNPVMVAVAERRDASGAVTRPASSRPMAYRVPRMVTRQATVKKPVAGPGERLHWGFLAPEIKAAFDGLGMDFGGYVLGEDGVHSLRPDQLIPVLWKAVQELLTRVDALEAERQKN